MEFPLVWDAKRSRGTVDGVGIVPIDHARASWQGKEFGLELKGVNPYHYRAAVDSNQPIASHLLQVDRYFLSGGMDLFVIIYENKGTQEWHEWVIEPDPARLDAQRLELAELNIAIDTKTLHPMLTGCKAASGKTWEECPYGGRNGPCARAGAWPTIRQPQSGQASTSAPST
jgi:hypothetical protein